jgi:hypothetical protein
LSNCHDIYRSFASERLRYFSKPRQVFFVSLLRRAVQQEIARVIGFEQHNQAQLLRPAFFRVDATRRYFHTLQPVDPQSSRRLYQRHRGWVHKIGTADIDEVSSIVLDTDGNARVSRQVLNKLTLASTHVFLRKYDAVFMP